MNDHAARILADAGFTPDELEAIANDLLFAVAISQGVDEPRTDLGALGAGNVEWTEAKVNGLIAYIKAMRESDQAS